MTTILRERAAHQAAIAPFARGPVLAIAAGVGLLLLLFSGRYGYFGDELYFLAAGRHLDWGYADQPPLLPLLAQIMDSIGPGSVTVLRLPAILVTAAGVVFAALIARELGGDRKAQVLTAGAFAACTQFLGTGHYLATSTMDPFLWTVLLWLVTRWVRTRSDGLLIWAGVVTAVAINVKFLMPVFWLAVGIGAIICGPRDLLRRPQLWLGALIAVAAAVPTIVWQANNGWPQWDMGRAISAEVTAIYGGRLAFLPTFLLTAGVIVGVVLFGYGLVRLFRSAELRPYRFLGVATVGVILVFLVVNGRSYYPAGMLPICWAAAAVEIERRRPAIWWRWVPTWPAYALSFLVAVPLALPILPASVLASSPNLPQPGYAGGEMAWPEVVDSVSEVYRSLPEGQRARTAVVTETYWDASALDHYGPDRGIPDVYSGNRGYWTLGTPPAAADSVFYVGHDPSRLYAGFTTVTPIGAIDAGPDQINFSHGKPIWLASGARAPWTELWPTFRRMGAD